MTKQFPGQIRQHFAKLSIEDNDAEDMVKLKSVELYSQGKLFKVLNAEYGNDKWTTPVLFNKNDRPGDYEVRWNFSFNGEPLDPQIEYITLQQKPTIHTDAESEVRDVANAEFERDDTIPEEIKELMRGMPNEV